MNFTQEKINSQKKRAKQLEYLELSLVMNLMITQL